VALVVRGGVNLRETPRFGRHLTTAPQAWLRSQSRTVAAGTCRQAATGRWPSPLALASSAAPMTSMLLARRGRHQAGSSTWVRPQATQRARSGRSSAWPPSGTRMRRVRALAHGRSVPPQPVRAHQMARVRAATVDTPPSRRCLSVSIPGPVFTVSPHTNPNSSKITTGTSAHRQRRPTAPDAQRERRVTAARITGHGCLNRGRCHHACLCTAQHDRACRMDVRSGTKTEVL
jgi:hypothetical protein